MLTCKTYQEVAEALRNKQSFQYRLSSVVVKFNVGQFIRNPIFPESHAPPLQTELPELQYRLKLVTTARTQILYSHSYDWPLLIAIYGMPPTARTIVAPLSSNNVEFNGYPRLPSHCQLTHIIVNESNYPVTSLRTTVRRQLNFALQHYLAPPISPTSVYEFVRVNTTHKLANGLASYIRDIVRLRVETQALTEGVMMLCAQNDAREIKEAVQRQQRKNFRKVYCTAIHRMGTMV